MKKLFPFICVFIVLCMSCSSPKSREPKNKNKRSEETIPVEVTRIKKETMRMEISTVGTVLPFQEVVVTPKVAGKIDKIFVKEGDFVKAGDILVQLDQTDFLLAVRQAEAALGMARANLANLLAGTRVEKIEQAKAALHQAEANLETTSNHWSCGPAAIGCGCCPV